MKGRTYFLDTDRRSMRYNFREQAFLAVNVMKQWRVTSIEQID